jgi:hypothetical protein
MPKSRRDRLPLEQVRWRLGKIWFIGAGFLFTLLIVQTLTGVYEEKVQAVWGWALPNFLPTLSLMIGVFASTALADEAESDRMKVRRPFANLATAVSLFHLSAVTATLLAFPFTATFFRSPEGEVNMMAVFDASNLFLGPLQGLVAGVIGVVFFTKQKEQPARDAEGGAA